MRTVTVAARSNPPSPEKTALRVFPVDLNVNFLGFRGSDLLKLLVAG